MGGRVSPRSTGGTLSRSKRRPLTSTAAPAPRVRSVVTARRTATRPLLPTTRPRHGRLRTGRFAARQSNMRPQPISSDGPRKRPAVGPYFRDPGEGTGPRGLARYPCSAASRHGRHPSRWANGETDPPGSGVRARERESSMSIGSPRLLARRLPAVRSWERWRPLLIVALLAGCASPAGPSPAGSDPGPTSSSTTPSIAVSTATPHAVPAITSVEPAAVIDVPGASGLIAVVTDGTTVWAAGNGAILRIDAATNRVEQLPAPTKSDDTTMAIADDGLWVTRWAGASSLSPRPENRRGADERRRASPGQDRIRR